MADSDRIPNGQSTRGPRFGEIRQTNHSEGAPLYAADCNLLYGDTTPVPTSDSGNYGSELNCQGYDYLMFFLEKVIPGTATKFTIALQFSHGMEWLDYYEDELLSGGPQRQLYDLPGPACFVVRIPVGAARQFRAGLWCTGGDATTRAQLRVSRGMNSV